ncbi:SDR family NAD(P)-dependent oxidoreductase [Pseudonocardia halophobica]|uniref:SDR family NAD(P)-dependent oxidoreductase n=1 Tax=Pseudonocardia halophobica TaxID=29401 RepID=UPI003D8F174B
MGDRLRGLAVVVTGAGSGIGRAASEAFAAEGADLVLADRDADAVEQVAKETGGLAVATDVTDEGQVAAMAAAAVDAFGRIDGLYANAGIDGAGRAHELTHTRWSQVLDVNLTGTWLTIRAVLPAMLAAGGGSIVTQASTAALTGVPDLAAYSAAKGGVTALTRQIAVDYGREGIRANALCPGTVWTPLVERTYAARGGDATFGSMDAMRERAARGYPLGRLGTPAEIAAFALFLLSPESSWISGGVFAADGGYTAR